MRHIQSVYSTWIIHLVLRVISIVIAYLYYFTFNCSAFILKYVNLHCKQCWCFFSCYNLCIFWYRHLKLNKGWHCSVSQPCWCICGVFFSLCFVPLLLCSWLLLGMLDTFLVFYFILCLFSNIYVNIDFSKDLKIHCAFLIFNISLIAHLHLYFMFCHLYYLKNDGILPKW